MFAWLRENYFFRKFPILKQLLKFAMVGVTSFLIDLGIYLALTRSFDFFAEYYLLANALSFMTAVGWSFVINKLWTFRVYGRSNLGGQYVRFVSVYAIGLLLTSLLLFVFVSLLKVIILLLNYLTIILTHLWN